MHRAQEEELQDAHVASSNEETKVEGSAEQPATDAVSHDSRVDQHLISNPASSDNGNGLVAGENIVSMGHEDEFGVDGQDPSGEEGYIGEFSRDYINAEIFKLFDVDGSGNITRSDLEEVAK